MTNPTKRLRVAGLTLLSVAAAGFVFHDSIVSSVTYAAEKGKLEAGREHLSRVEEISDTFRMVAKQVKPAVVQIMTTTAPKTKTLSPTARRQQQRIDPRDLRELPEPFRKYFEDFGDGKPFQMPAPKPTPEQASGSGVIIDAENGYVLTNNHVASDDDGQEMRIEVTLADGRTFSGSPKSASSKVKLLGTDPHTDLALLQIPAERLHAVTLGDSDQLEVGDWVLAIGAPFGLEQTVTQGIISAKGRSTPIADYNDFLQTDAAINPGNSGGPLVNMHGEVIGINTAIATSGTVAGYMGVGFSIPSNMVKDILPTLQEGKEVVRGYLGVGIKGSDEWQPWMARSYGLKEKAGVLLEDYAKIPGIKETPAEKAGLKRDDIILSFDGKKVKTTAELQGLVSHTKPGTKVDLNVWRNKEEITIPATIEKQPENFFARSSGGRGRGPHQQEEDQSAEEAAIEALGMTVEPLTDETAKQFGWTDDADAKNKLVVTEVEPLGEAAAVHIGPGDLIDSVQGKPVNSVSALRDALGKEQLANGVRIKVRSPPKGSARTGYWTAFLQLSS